MEWNLFTYEEVIEQSKKPPVTYTDKQYREYIKEHFKPSYMNQMFYNIVMCGFYHDWESSVIPQEQLEWFKRQYNNFTYHLQTDEITLFSLKHEWDNAEEEYSLFIKIADDFIVELPRVKDLFHEVQCMPACAINWYNPDGTRADISKVLVLTNEEKETWIDFVKNANEIINPKETSSFSYSEWWKDRREYFSFYKLKLHKFGKPCRVFEKHIYDNFADYTFTFMDLFNFYHKEEE